METIIIIIMCDSNDEFSVSVLSLAISTFFLPFCRGRWVMESSWKIATLIAIVAFFFRILLSVLWPFYAHLMGWLFFFFFFFYSSYRMDAKIKVFSYYSIGHLCVKMSQFKPLKQQQFYPHSPIVIFPLFYAVCNVPEQQNKWYPRRCLLIPFEATVWKIEYSFEMGK